MISPSIKWDHSEDWFVASFDTHMSDRSGERMVKISLSDKKFEYLAGHVVDGKCRNDHQVLLFNFDKLFFQDGT